MRRFVSLTAAVLLAAGAGAQAARAQPASTRAAGTQGLAAPAATKVINQALHSFGTFKVLHTTPGPANMTAALVRSGQHEAIVWIVGSGQAVLLGRALGPEGQNLSQQAAVRMGVAPKALSPAEVAAEVAKHETFVVGTHGPELTAFMDPNCIWCHRLYEEAKPVIAAGKLRLRVILVAIIKPSSSSKAVAILAAKDRAGALALDEQHFNTTTETGGIPPAKNIPPKLGQAVHANTELLEKTGEAVTPTLLFQNADGEWKIVHGLPQAGIKAVLESMAGGKTAAANGQATPATK